MASLPGVRFDITGASGTQGLLSPKSGWRAYFLPRGGFASQDSTGTKVTFDTADVAARFAANNWIQAGLSVDNIRQVSSVGGNSFLVTGAALTVSENDRIFLIGDTQPTVSGGSATYITPDAIIRERDDDSSDIISNSMVTSNAQGLIQAFAESNFYDCILQDGNQANQSSIADLSIGVVEGVSVSGAAVFGSTVTINGALGVTGTAVFGDTMVITGTSDDYKHTGDLTVLDTLIAPRIGPSSSAGAGGAIRYVDGDTFPLTSAGIQAAIDDLPAAGGKVQLPAGTIPCASDISITIDNVAIEGAGMGVTVLDYTNGGTAITFATTGGLGVGHHLSNLEIQTGANQTGYLLQFTGEDRYWSINNVLLRNPNAAVTLGSGLSLLNCQNGLVNNIRVRGNASNLFTVGIDVTIDDAAQRGNIVFNGGEISQSITGCQIASGSPGNSVNNCVFNGTKFTVSSSVADGADDKIGVELHPQADQTAFLNCHIERFQTGISNTNADCMQVIGGLISLCENAAANAGRAIGMSGSQGCFISTPRIDTCYDGVVIEGSANDCVYVRGRVGNITNEEFINTSTGSRGSFRFIGAHNTQSIRSFNDGSATPSIAGSEIWKTANTSPTTITNLDDGVAGQIVRILIRDTQTTIDFTGTSLFGNVGVDWTPTTNDHMTCVTDGVDWYCTVSDNTA